MNKEQGRAERDYRLVKAVFMTLRDKGIITVHHFTESLFRQSFLRGLRRTVWPQGVAFK